jgi:hypothetical protein
MLFNLFPNSDTNSNKVAKTSDHTHTRAIKATCIILAAILISSPTADHTELFKASIDTITY